MPPHPLTNFETWRYYQNKPKFNGVYTRNYLPFVPTSAVHIKDEAYVINIDEYKSIGTHWIVLLVNGDNATYFNIFGVEYIPQKIKKFMRNKNITISLYRIQVYDSIICG